MDPARINILLLGPPAILVNNRVVNIQRRSLRSLLFFLACNRQPVGRASLILLFWPDNPENKARTYLRDSLSKLRAALPHPEILQADRDNVWLDNQRSYVDVLEFEDYAARLRSEWNSRPSLSADQVSDLHRMLRLWRSPQFLAGINPPREGQFDQWLSHKSSSLEHDRHYLLSLAADHAIASGDLDSALLWLHSALDTNPIDDQLNLNMVKCLVELGRKGEALHHMDNIRRLYRREHVGDLPPAFDEFEEQIQRMNRMPVPADQSDWDGALNLHTPFVGRKNQLRVLEDAYWRGSSAIIMGEPGAGKTRLARELHITIKPTPRLMLTQCHSSESNLPFQPLIDLLRNNITPTEWQTLAPSWRACLEPLMPELATPAHDLSDQPIVPAGDRQALVMEAIHQALLLAAEHKRILVVMDNAHWSDESTNHTLAYLTERHFFHEHGMLLLTARTGEMPVYLWNFIHHSHRPHEFVQVPLTGLDEEEAQTLTTFVLGRSLPRRLQERLLTDSGGNPFFLLENLRALLPYLPDLPTPDKMPLAASVRALAQNRINLLSAPARMLLEVISVLEMEAPPDLLENITGFSSDQATAALEELEAARIIKSSDNQNYGLCYLLVHEIIRSAVLAEISAARRRNLHLKTARALQAHLGPLPHLSSVLARHFELGSDFRQAFTYWVQAGQHASRVASRKEAYTAFRQAERLLKRTNFSLPDTVIYNLYHHWFQLAYDCMDIRMLQTISQTMIRLGEQLHSPLLVGLGYGAMAQLKSLLNENQQAWESAQQAIPYLQRCGNKKEVLEGYNRLGLMLAYINRLQPAYLVLENARELSRGLNDESALEAMSTTEYNLALVQLFRGYPVKSIEHAQNSLHYAESLFYNIGKIRARTVLARAYFNERKFENAVQQAELGLQQEGSAHNNRIFVYLLTIKARSLLLLGRLDEAMPLIIEARAACQGKGYKDILSGINMLQGEMHLFCADAARAAEFFRSGCTDSGSELSRIYNQAYLGLALYIAGNPASGTEQFQLAIEEALHQDLGIVFSPLQLLMAHVRIGLGDVDEVKKSVDHLAELIRQRPCFTSPLHYLAIRAELAFHHQQWDDALRFTRLLHQESVNTSTVWLQRAAIQINRKIALACGMDEAPASQELAAWYQRMEGNMRHPVLRDLYVHMRAKEIADQ